MNIIKEKICFVCKREFNTGPFYIFDKVFCSLKCCHSFRDELKKKEVKKEEPRYNYYFEGGGALAF